MVALDEILRWLVESADDEDAMVVCTDSPVSDFVATSRSARPELTTGGYIGLVIVSAMGSVGGG